MNNCENIVIIPSLIDCYGHYTRNQRYDQTLNTIYSVRDKIPKAFIVLIDISEFTEQETKYLNQICDLFLNQKDNDLIKKVRHAKSYGEKSYIQYALFYLNDFKDDYKFSKFLNLKSIFKVGGRYFLNDNFNFNNYNNNLDNVKIIPQEMYKNGCESCLFKINVNNVKNFILHLESEEGGVYLGLDTHNMENVIYKYIYLDKSNFIHLNVLGMTAIPSNGGNIFDV